MSLFTRTKCPTCGQWTERPHDHGGEEPEGDDEVKGWQDAQDGVTTCPWSKWGGARQEAAYRRWHRGYDKAESSGLAKLPRFRDASGRRRPSD